MSKRLKSSRRKRRGSTLWQIATVTSPARSLVVLLCLLVAGIAEGVGIASLLPLLASIDNSGSGSSELGRIVFSGLDAVGIPAEPGFLLLVLVGGVVLKAGLVLVAMRQVGYAVADVSTRMRVDLMNALLGARWPFFVAQPLGRFASAIGGEANRAGQAYHAVAQFVAKSVQAAVYLSLAALVSWQLALFSLVIGTVLVMSLSRLVVTARRNAKRHTQRLKILISRMAEVLIGIKPIKAMGRQAQFGRLFQKDAEMLNRAMRVEVLSRNANKVLQEPILVICLAAAIYAAITVWALPIGELLIMGVLMVQTVSMVGKAQQDLQVAKIAQSGYRAVHDAIEDARAARETGGGGGIPTFKRGLEFRDVWFAYGDREVVADASFTVPAGKTTAIVGPSGIGKTTLGDMILGLHQPDAGEVLVDGVPLPQLDLTVWRKMTGYVPQEIVLFHDTITANVALGDPEFTRAHVEEALREAGAWEFVSNLPEGVDTIVGERGARLSGGQRQRIAVARALIHSPKLLILDEATSALDPATEQAIVRNICELSRRTGLTVLSISHQQVWMEKADVVLRVENGRVLEAPLMRQYVS